MAEFPPSKMLKDLLVTHVASSGWQLEIGAMPDSPDEVIQLTDTVGIEPNPKYLLDYPSVQVMTRGSANGYLDAYRESKAVKDLLLGIDSFTTADGDRVVSITQNGDLGFIGRDSKMRPMFTINWALIIVPQVPVGDSNRIAL